MDYQLNDEELIVGRSDLILITGAGGFIGKRLVDVLLKYGFRNLRCLIRPSGDVKGLQEIADANGVAELDIMEGNLQSLAVCNRAAAGAAVICHLAAGMDKSFPGAFMNSVVTTRNLLESAVMGGNLKRFVNVSSFTVYSNANLRRNAELDETTPTERNPVVRGDAYAYAKVKQDELVLDYAQRLGLPVTILRPGSVFGPGKSGITGRVGIDTFGLYLHLGGSNRIPFTFVDNCAEAIALAAVKRGADGEVFNIVDDDLPTSRAFLRGYKRNVRSFKSVYVPYPMSYLLSFLWEKYSHWSKGQLPPAFNRSRARTEWKGNVYPNGKLKRVLGWKPRVTMQEGLARYYAFAREAQVREAR